MSQKQMFDLVITRYIDAHVQLYDFINTPPVCERFNIQRDKASSLITAYRTNPNDHCNLRYDVINRRHEKAFTFQPKFRDVRPLQLLTAIDEVFALRGGGNKEMVDDVMFCFLEAFVLVHGYINTKTLSAFFLVDRSRASGLIRLYSDLCPFNVQYDKLKHNKCDGFDAKFLRIAPKEYLSFIEISFGKKINA